MLPGMNSLMWPRIAIALGLMLAAFLSGIKVDGWRRDARELKREQAAQREVARLVEISYKAGQQLTQVIERERIVTRTIKEALNVYLPTDALGDVCRVLPAGWRVLHDSAAQGVDPAAASGSDAAGPSPQAAAEAVIDNYSSCRRNAARLGALQDYVRAIRGEQDH